jgi:hypothetical protein
VTDWWRNPASPSSRPVLGTHVSADSLDSCQVVASAVVEQVQQPFRETVVRTVATRALRGIDEDALKVE